MKTSLRLFFAHLFLVGAVVAAEPAASAESQPQTREELFAEAGVKVVKGPTTAALGRVAEIRLPEDYLFIGEDSLDRFFELTRNTRNGKEVGVVLAPQDWMLFFDYDPIGYVKDDDKDALDAVKLMQSMTENQERANAARRERGWDEMKLKGWATEPHYDAKTNNLKWAINLTSSRDNHQGVWINEDIRLLGRSGVMNVTLVSDAEVFKSSEREADALLASNFNYVQGEKYAEFKEGDKVAAYGLAALVLGGGAAVAAKAGLLAKFAAMVGKGWKFIVAALVAVWLGIKRFFNKLSGARPEDPAP